MTVKELIRLLEGQDQNAEIVFGEGTHTGAGYVLAEAGDAVSGIEPGKDKYGSFVAIY